MGSCYSGDYIAEYHIYTDITTYNIEDHNRSTALERSIIDFLGRGGGRGTGPKHVLLDPNHRYFVCSGSQNWSA